MPRAPGGASPAERWVLRPAAPRPGSRLRLVCVPYAGGGAAVFHGWADRLPAVVEPWVLRLPGREARFAEPPATDLVRAAAEAAEALAPILHDMPFAFFGHSLGGFVAFETVRSLAERWGLDASLLVVSARNAPHLRGHVGTVHQLSDEDFLAALDLRYRAIPPAIREDAGLLAVYLPLLRGDVRLLETYRYRAGRRLRCPVVALGGAEDPEMSLESLSSWGELTDGGASSSLLPGGHFFLQSHRGPLFDELAPLLLRTLAP
ncbi:thioesterase II family protein [Kitasatospora sp. NPDC091207]|uniref:thioesterase II family protein n=1 Tax=Kitasatospora sp. NPDC091207 TaxID=3364083 RepID=UPI00380A4354